MPEAGIEPARCFAPADFESAASTNFATPASEKRKLWHSLGMNYPSIEAAIGQTPIARLQRIGAADNAARGNVLLGKLEGNNPAGSVKDRPAMSMIQRAEARGDIQDRKSTRLNSSHSQQSRMPSSA